MTSKDGFDNENGRPNWDEVLNTGWGDEVALLVTAKAIFELRVIS